MMNSSLGAIFKACFQNAVEDYYNGDYEGWIYWANESAFILKCYNGFN